MKKTKKIIEIKLNKEHKETTEKIPPEDLGIIQQIASFFGEHSEKAKKILIARYKKYGSRGVIVGYDGNIINLKTLFTEQEALYWRRKNQGTQPTIGTLEVALGKYSSPQNEKFQMYRPKTYRSKKRPNLSELDSDFS